MSAEYKQALKAAQDAGEAWQAAKRAYHAGFITEAQFLHAKELFKASEEAFDAAYYDECNQYDDRSDSEVIQLDKP